MINQNITEENRITFDNPYKYEYKYSPNIGDDKHSWFFVEHGCLYEVYYSDIHECEIKSHIHCIRQLPANMLIGEIRDLQQIMYVYGAGNFEISQ